MAKLIDELLSDRSMHDLLLTKLNTLRQKVERYKEGSTITKKMLEWYQLYKSFPDIYRTKEKWEANLFVPLTFQHVSTIHPRLVTSIFGVNPLFEVIGETPDAAKKADDSQLVLNSMFYHSDFYTALDEAILFSLILGTGILKYVVTKDGSITRVFPENCDPITIGNDPSSCDFEQSKYCYHDVYKPIWHLLEKEKMGLYKGIDRIIKDPSIGCNEILPSINRLASIGMAPSDFRTEDHRLTEYYLITQNPLTDDEYQNLVITVVDDKYIIRAEENKFGFFPFERLVAMPVPGEFYGISVPQIIQYLQYEANEKRNQVLDANKLVVNPIWTVTYKTILGAYRDRDIPMEPGTIIDVAEQGVIEPLKFNFQALMAGYQELSGIKEDMKDALGVMDYNRGAPRAGDSTATEVVSLINEGNMRFLKMIINIEHAMQKIAKSTMRLLKENMFPDESVRITELNNKEAALMRNDYWKQLKPTDIEYNYEYRCAASAAYNMRAIERQYILQFVQMIAQDQAMMEEVDRRKMWKMVARAMNIKDLSFLDKKIVEPKELPPTMTPDQMAQMLGGALGGGAPQGAPQIPPQAMMG